MTKRVNPFSLSMICCCLAFAALFAVPAVGQSVRPIAPQNRATVPLTVVFKWELKNPNPRIAYCSEILTDKGSNPYDGGYEDRFDAGQASELRVELPSDRYENETFEWGVRVKACNRKGRSFYSPVRMLRTTATAPLATASPEPPKPLANPASAEPATAPETPVVPDSYAPLDRLSGEWEMQAEYASAVKAGVSSSSFSFSAGTMRITGKKMLKQSEPGTITFQLAEEHTITLRYDPKAKTYRLTVKAEDYVKAADLPTDVPLAYSDQEGFTASAETGAKFTPKIIFTEGGGHLWHLAPDYKITFKR